MWQTGDEQLGVLVRTREQQLLLWPPWEQCRLLATNCPVCLIYFNFMLPRRLERLIINMGMGGKPWENHYLANIHKYPLDLCDPLEWVCLIKCIFPQNTWHAPNKPMLRISWELRTSCFLNHLTKKHRHLTIPFKLLPAENFPQTDKCSMVFCSWSSSRHPPPQVTWYWCL